ncbi:MAG: DUF4252 domain-containing protein [Dysgonomonas sp.]|uniref:DUF4252 domain-containing protein n=1 Tax=Dysgonomonas sp. TaxID=1891233 RepID=UPI003A882660
MKKYAFCLISVLLMSLTGYSQSIDQLLKNVSKIENIEKVKIGGFLMSVGKMFGGVNNIPLARGVKTLEVYDLSDCNANQKQDISIQFNQIKDSDGYETLMYVREDGDEVRIMIKKDKDLIREMVFLCMDKADPAIIRFSGKIKESDIAELVNKYNK